jgi:dihydroxy-acid dehydratase
VRRSVFSSALIADSIELMVTAHALDAMVLLTNCDKVTPGMLIAAGRLNIPAIVVSGGPMEAGCFRGRQVCHTDLIEAEGWVGKGNMSREELARFERAANPGPGSCAMMGTANTMNMLTEALGMTLTDGALIPATHGARIALARQAGRRIIGLYRENILPRDILTLEALENAIAVDMAIGGSTNTCLHLPVIAHEAGIQLTMGHFAEIAEWTPHLVLLKPAGRHYAQDMHEAGGIPALMNEMIGKGLIHPDCMTATGRTIAENVAGREIADQDVIHPVSNPISPMGASRRRC